MQLKEGTGQFLSYLDIENSSVEVGTDENCFLLQHEMCGPDSVSFLSVSTQNLFMTLCNGTILMKKEYDFCGYVLLIFFCFIYFFISRNIANQCWKNETFIDSAVEGEYKFLLYGKDSTKLLLSETDSDKVLAEDIEKIIKENGFLDDDDSPTASEFILTCTGVNEWKYQPKDGLE